MRCFLGLSSQRSELRPLNIAPLKETRRHSFPFPYSGVDTGQADRRGIPVQASGR